MLNKVTNSQEEQEIKEQARITDDYKEQEAHMIENKGDMAKTKKVSCPYCHKRILPENLQSHLKDCEVARERSLEGWDNIILNKNKEV